MEVLDRSRNASGGTGLKKLGKRISDIFTFSSGGSGRDSRSSTARSQSYLKVVTVCQGAGAMKARSKEDRIVALDNLEEFVQANFRSYDLTKFGDNDFPPAPPTREEWPRDMHYDDDYFSGRNGRSRPENQDLISEAKSNGAQIVPPESASQSTPSEPLPPNSSLPNSRRSVFKLFCVFDGHCGQMCSSYLQYRFPFQLAGSDEFKAGNFEQALAKAFRTCHEHLLMCTKYGPEAPANDFSSGATASAILVTPQNTYFAFVGDSPILIQYRDRSKPEILFKEHDIENEVLHKYIVDANMFLVGIREGLMHHDYHIITEPEVKTKVFLANMKQKEADSGTNRRLSRSSSNNSRHSASRKGNGASDSVNDAYKYDDIRVGMSALNVWGTLGDSIYDARVFNTFVKELHEFREERYRRWKKLMEQNNFPIDSKLDHPHHDLKEIATIDTLKDATPDTDAVVYVSQFSAEYTDNSSEVQFGFEKPTFPKESLKGLNPRAQFSYVEFREWVVSRPAWQALLCRHISLLPKESQMSRILLAAIHKLRYPYNALVKPGLIRTPATARVANKRLKLFCVASDGVIRFYEQLKNEFDSLIVKYADNNMEKCVEEMKKLMEWVGDDRSLILGKFIQPVLDTFESVPHFTQSTSQKSSSSQV